MRESERERETERGEFRCLICSGHRLLCVYVCVGEREEESRCLICSGWRLLLCVCVCERENGERGVQVLNI